ncbi:UNVERIFIED_CONTAM: hypothetical protein Slati_1299300 [Sesamum latifolium]|uniref:Uncharacterized protein n=1 Tax=Sesamum latifolium TaxID=2727402 RepID=A0AAW2XK35_9LAMI
MKPTHFLFLSALLALLLFSFAAANDAIENDNGANQVANEKQSYGDWGAAVVGGRWRWWMGVAMVVDGWTCGGWGGPGGGWEEEDGADIAILAAAIVVTVEGASSVAGQLKKH